VIVLEALERVNRELGTTTVIITHNVAQSEMAERIVFLSDGEVTEIRQNARKKPARELVW
jgi:putative ABC transport system ATP-binding protein